MPIVKLDHIRKVYDTKVAVEDLSLTVEAGTTDQARPVPSA
jgi:ABC-type uncharacterized transport system ATPase subunit